MIRYLCILPLLATLAACNNEAEKIQTQQGSITESVYSSVIIQPDSLYKVYPAINGILERNLVEEGDTVDKGQALLLVENTAPKLAAANALLSLELAQENYSGASGILSGLKQEIALAQLTLTNDSINYCRQRNLWEQQIGSRQQYDSMKLQYEQSLNRLQQLQDNYDRTENELSTGLVQAQNNYNAALEGSNDFTVNSQINGKVYALYKNQGEQVSAQQPLALVGSTDAFIIEMLVDEVDIVKISHGQQVIITLDAYAGQTFTAKVSKIYPEKDQRNQTFVIEGLFDSPPEVLYPGLAGEASIVIAQKEQALFIPKDYLIDGNRVLTDEGEVTLEIGLQSLDKVEVLSGLTAGTWIYKPE